MRDSPTTFRAESGESVAFEWNDAAELHRREDQGVLSRFKAIRRGTLAELVRFVMTLPEEDRADYAIQKSGDRRFEYPEIAALAQRSDLPKE